MTYESHIQAADKAFTKGASTYQVDARTFDIEYVHRKLRLAGKQAGKDWKYGKWRNAVIIKPRKA